MTKLITVSRCKASKPISNILTMPKDKLIKQKILLKSEYFFAIKIINKLIIDPSVRLQYYASISEFSPEPRLGLKYNLSDNIRLKAAGGLYAQNLIAANSDRDVVNFFYGFLSAPDDLPSEFDGKSIKKNYSLHVMQLLGLNMTSTNILILTLKAI